MRAKSMSRGKIDRDKEFSVSRPKWLQAEYERRIVEHRARIARELGEDEPAASATDHRRRWTTCISDGRDQTFPSVEAAAAHYGINPYTLFKSLRLGRQTRVIEPDGRTAVVRFERVGKHLTTLAEASVRGPRGEDFEFVRLTADAPGDADHAST